MSTPFGKFLREYRLNLDVTQTELAEILRCHPMVISKIETGRFIPDIAFIDQLQLSSQQRAFALQRRHQSRLRDVLPENASMSAYEFCSDLFDQLNTVHPKILNVMHEILKASPHYSWRLDDQTKIDQ